MSYFWKNGLVELKMIREEDSHNFYDVLMDTQTRKQAEHGIYLPATVQYAKDMADNAMVNNEEGDELWFSIRNMDEEPVGYAVIDWINEKMGNAQLSITVYRQYRGLGYAGSAASILLEYLFNERRFHKVGCNIMEDNEEGKTFVESMGFTLDAFRSGMFYHRLADEGGGVANELGASAGIKLLCGLYHCHVTLAYQVVKLQSSARVFIGYRLHEVEVVAH